MSINRTRSTIKEVRDQLFLNTSSGRYLNVISSNLGIDRPNQGFSDDEWRAVVKEIALRPKVVRNIFHRIIEICVGPQKTRVANISQNSSVGDQIIQLEDANDLIQLGTVIIDPKLPTEETINFCFRDLGTHEIVFSTRTIFDHSPVVSASSFLRSDIPVGSTSIPLIDSSNFPIPGNLYTVILDRGNENEELVVITANNVSTNTLTSIATVKSHTAATVTFLRKSIAEATVVGRTFVKLGTNETRNFPTKGFIRLNFGGGTEEVKEYTSNQIADNVLILKRPLEFAHSVGESVELMNPGASVETVSLIQSGINWSIHETEPNKLKIFIPEDFQLVRLLDASFLHDEVDIGGIGSTTVNGSVTAGAIDLPVVSVRDFPEAGIINIDSGGEITFYTKRLSGHSIEKSNNIEPFALTNGQTLLVSVDGSAAATATFNTADFDNISTALSQEVANVINTDIPGATAYSRDKFVQIHSNTNGTIEITGGTANTILEFDSPTLVLSKTLVNALSGGESVDEVQVPYGGTSLEEGNWRSASGVVQPNRFPGPYIYDASQRGVSADNSTIATLIPPPTEVSVNSIIGQTNLEVEDAGLFPSAPQNVRIGRETGFQEDANLLDVTLAKGLSTTVNANVGAGVSSLTGGDTTGFPESDGVNIAGYRVIIDLGGANEEIITVNQNTSGTPGTFSFTTLTTQPHNIGETIELLKDVLTFNTLTKVHIGLKVVPPSPGHFVELLISDIDVASGVPFPTDGGWVWINFGKEVLNQLVDITNVVSASILELSSTNNFPASNFPYRVIVSEGRPEQEFAFVSANDTGTNRLTFSPSLSNTHQVGSLVRFISGEPIALEYNSRSGNTLNISTRIFDTKHVVGERVIFSPKESVPSINGTDYAFLLPPDPGRCLSLLFDLVRGAGIEIVFLSSK